MGLSVPPHRPPPRSIGLTGGIGSGKSTVAATLAQCGAHVVDVDAIAHRLTGRGGAAMPAIEAAFGRGVVGADGALDRAAMRGLAFGDPDAKRRLEAVLHPLIQSVAQAEGAAAQAAGKPALFDIPLLAESNHWRPRLDRIIVVDCSEATQVRRVMQRSGWTAEAVERVIALQAPRRHRRSIADAVVYNDGLSPEQLAAEVRALWALWNNNRA